MNHHPILTHVTHNSITTTLCGMEIRHGEPATISLKDALRYRGNHELGSHVDCLQCCRMVREMGETAAKRAA